MRRGCWSPTLLALSLLALAACSDDTVAPPPDKSIVDTRGPDAGPLPDKALPDKGPAPDQAVANGPLTINVYTGNVFKWDYTKTPFAGATVAFDLPGGTRVEKTTGADGKATIDEVAWSKGTVTVTGHAKGMRPLSFLGIRKQDGDQELWLFPIKPAWVPVTGNWKNLDPAAKSWAGAATVPSKPIVYGVNNYETGVPPGVPFSMVGMQYDVDSATASPRDRLFKIAGWCKTDSPAITAATALDVDCATKQPVTPFKASITLPTDPKSLLRTSTTAAVFVTDFDSALGSWLGYASKATIAADGNSFNLEAEHVALAGVKEPVTFYQLSVGAYQGSTVVVPGAPVDGAKLSGFLEQPTLVKPASPSTPAAFTEPIEWTSAETVRARLTLWRGNPVNYDLDPVWALWVMPGATKIVLPDPPSTVDVTELLGADPVYGQVNLCDFDTAKYYCKRNVGGKLFKLKPPPPNCTPDKWCRVYSAPSDCGPFSVGGTGASDIFVGLKQGRVAHYDGKSWTIQTVPTQEQVTAFWVAAPKDIFATADKGGLLRYDGTSWTAMAAPTGTGNLQRVWGTSAKDVFAVGEKGAILHYDGTSWTSMTSGTTVHLWGLWGASGTDIWAGGEAGVLLHYDGKGWSPVSLASTQPIRDLWGSGPSDIWAATGSTFTSGAAVLHYDGTTWSEPYKGKLALNAVWGAGPNDVWGVGIGNSSLVALHWDGTTWTQQNLGTSASGIPTAVWGPSASEVYVTLFGLGGPVLRRTNP